MNTVKLNAYAKLNLTLDITGREGGYHLLDSLVTTIDLCDRVVLKKRKDGLSSVTMHGMGSEAIPPEENNALRAAEAFSERFGTAGVDITVYKNIPLAAGLGGSSADTAAVIAGMGRLFSVKDRAALKELADEFGSDTGYLLTGGLARMRGRGERIAPLPFEKLHVLILLPKSGVSTKECYAKFDGLGCKPSARTEEAVRLLTGGNPAMAAQAFGNDLYAPAKSLNPEVEQAYKAAWSFSPLGASMTGSGSAVFAVFETEELCAWAKSRYKGRCRAITAKSVDPNMIKMPRNPFALGEEGGRGGYMAEERLTDDPFKRKLQEDEISEEVEFEVEEEYDEDLVGLTPSQLEEKLEAQRRAEEKAQKEYRKLLADAEEKYAAGNFEKAAVLYAQAALYEDEKGQSAYKHWVARTENFENTEVFYEKGVAEEFVEAPSAVRKKVQKQVGEQLAAARAQYEEEASPLREKVEAGMHSRREAFRANRNYWLVRFLVALAFLAVFGIACAVAGDYIIRTRSMVAPVLTIVFGVLALAAFIVLVIFSRKLFVAQRLVSTNEKLSSTEDGARLAYLEKRIYALELVLSDPDEELDTESEPTMSEEE